MHPTVGLCDIVWGMLRRARPASVPCGAGEVGLRPGAGKSPPWEFGLRNTQRPGHYQCLWLGDGVKPAQPQGLLGVLPTATSRSSQRDYLLTLWESLLCFSAAVLFCARDGRRGEPELSLGQRTKGESRVPSLEVGVNTAEATNSQGQRCPAASVLWRAALRWPDKEVGGQEGC